MERILRYNKGQAAGKAAPFLACYRKERTGGFEIVIEQIHENAERGKTLFQISFLW
ncbi:MAG: hypothetical protein ABIJ27_06830 [Candidatus Omnitrophota bacterium]